MYFLEHHLGVAAEAVIILPDKAEGLALYSL